MSSIVDGLINSDNPDLDLAHGARTNGASKMPNSRGAQRSSMPPSESNGALSDVEGFPDDEVVGARGTDRNRPKDPMARAVPRVVDRVGEKVAEEFENFLDQCDPFVVRMRKRLLTCSDSLKTLRSRVPLLRAP